MGNQQDKPVQEASKPLVKQSEQTEVSPSTMMNLPMLTPDFGSFALPDMSQAYMSISNVEMPSLSTVLSTFILLLKC